MEKTTDNIQRSTVRETSTEVLVRLLDVYKDCTDPLWLCEQGKCIGCPLWPEYYSTWRDGTRYTSLRCWAVIEEILEELSIRKIELSPPIKGSEIKRGDVPCSECKFYMEKSDYCRFPGTIDGLINGKCHWGLPKEKAEFCDLCGHKAECGQSENGCCPHWERVSYFGRLT